MAVSPETQLNEWAAAAAQFHLPRWNELPELELYMDQVIVFLESKLSGLLEGKDRVITPAMVNNYVKLGLIPKPDKKKYSRRHLAYLVVITLLKELFSISQVKDAIQLQTAREGGAQPAYDAFCAEIEAALAVACAVVSGQPLPQRSAADGSRLQRLAAQAFAFRAAAVREVLLQRPEPAE